MTLNPVKFDRRLGVWNSCGKLHNEIRRDLVLLERFGRTTDNPNLQKAPDSKLKEVPWTGRIKGNSRTRRRNRMSETLIGTWNIRNLNRIVALQTFSKELRKYQQTFLKFKICGGPAHEYTKEKTKLYSIATARKGNLERVLSSVNR